MKKSKPEVVIEHLKKIGRITDATARAAYGSFRLADAIYRLRNERSDLVPRGKTIITVPRIDAAENLFAEYRLVEEAHA